MNINELRAQRAKIIKDAQALSQSEGYGSGETEAQFNKMMDDASRIANQIRDIEKAAQLQADIEKSITDIQNKGFDGDEDAQKEQRARVYDRAFLNLLRNAANISGLSTEDRNILNQGFVRNAQEIATGAKGGFTVPRSFYAEVMVALKNFDALRQAGAFVLTTENGQAIPWPGANDTTVKGRLVAEGAASQATDITFVEKTLNAYAFTSDEIVVSNELLQDTGVDLISLIARLAGERIGRAFADFSTTGTGTNQPEGIVTASTLGKSASIGAGGINYDALVDLKYSVDAAYRQSPSCGWMMNDAILKEVVKIKDTTGQPIFLASTRDGEADRILNHPVFINNAMDSTAVATKKPVLFGSFSNYVIRDVSGMALRILDQVKAVNNQTSFILFSRHDGKFIDAGGGAMKHILMAA